MGVFHVSVRRLAKHRGEIIAYLPCLKIEYDVIVFSEIRKGAEYFAGNMFDGYNNYTSIPQNNAYGGVAIFVKNKYKIAERDYLHLIKIVFAKTVNQEVSASRYAMVK